MPGGDGLSRNCGENAVWSGWKLRVGEKMKWTKQIYDIFISYKDDGEGRNFAARLSADLKKMGYDVYYNQEEQRAGNFPQKIREAVEGCRDFLLIMSESCIRQLTKHEKIDWVREELLVAEKCEKNIIPLLMPGVSMPKDKDNMPEDLRFLPDKNAVTMFEPYDKSPLETIIKWMNSSPVGNKEYKFVFQGNDNYDVESDFRDTLRQAEAGNEKAMYEIANMYFYGFTDGNGESVRDFSKAYLWLKKLYTGKGRYSAVAASMIGRMYYRGVVQGERQSYKKALEFHEEAAAGGIAQSQLQCAFMQSVGMGCETNYDAAEKEYISAIQQGDDMAVSGLAQLYYKLGEFDKAENLYRSIVNSHPQAACELGCLYMDGLSSNDKKPNCINAAFYFQHAISSGNCIPEARYKLGLLYFRGMNGFMTNFRLAQESFELAAQAGHAQSAYMVGYMYEHGIVESNIEKAVKYHTMAADRGHALSPVHLAIIYQMPECLDYCKAYKYAKLSAEYGNAEGEFICGNLLFFGRGCKADNHEAYKMHKKAYEHGLIQAEFMLERIEKAEAYMHETSSDKTLTAMK